MSDEKKPLDLKRLRDRLDISHLVGSPPPSLPRGLAIDLIAEAEQLRERNARLEKVVDAARADRILRQTERYIPAAVLRSAGERTGAALAELDAEKKP